jgi:hypothetical protein
MKMVDEHAGSGVLYCSDCLRGIELGVLLVGDDPRAGYFQSPASSAVNWKNRSLSMALWKFLADHTSHAVAVVFGDGAPATGGKTANPGSPAVIGKDVDIDGYIAGWPNRPGGPR